MEILNPPRQSHMLLIFYTIFFISTIVSPYTHHPIARQPSLLTKRQTPSGLENSILNPLSPNPPGSNRASNLTPTPTPSDPAANSSSTPTVPNPTSPNKDKDSALIPLLGPSLGIPTPSPTPPSTNSSSTPPTNSTAAPPAASANLPATTTPPSNKSSTPTNPTSSTSPLPSPTSEPTPNHSPASNPATNRPAESHASNDKSTFGSTTVKLLAITGGVVAGLFLLWTVIRKWKFRPSKRFANKLEDYDEHMFEPRPPSFSEKRPNEYPSYPAKQLPIRSPSPGQYPSHPSERAHTPSNIPRQNLFSQGPSPYNPVHRLSNISVTKPLPIFESNYRLSLGLGSEISHSYPPVDHPQPNAL